MPELPDIAAYLSALEERVLGKRLDGVRVASPFLLRTARPRVEDVEGQTIRELRRVGKRIAFGFESGMWAVLHLMIAGRLHWRGGRSWVGAIIWRHLTLLRDRSC